MQIINIQGYTYGPSEVMLRKLERSLQKSGGWIFDHHTLSATTYEILLEFELRHTISLYAAIMGTGLELTRADHMLLTDLCTCQLHPKSGRKMDEVVGMVIGLSFLNDVGPRNPTVNRPGASEPT